MISWWGSFIKKDLSSRWGECFKLKRLWHCAGNGRIWRVRYKQNAVESFCGENSFDLGEEERFWEVGEGVSGTESAGTKWKLESVRLTMEKSGPWSQKFHISEAKGTRWGWKGSLVPDHGGPWKSGWEVLTGLWGNSAASHEVLLFNHQAVSNSLWPHEL